MDVWRLIETERLRVAEALGSVEEYQWPLQSLCVGWSNHLTLAHLVGSSQVNLPRAMRAMVASGFNFGRMVDKLNVRTAKAPSAQLVSKLRELAPARDHPPGPAVAQLLEVVVHGEDIAYPLGVKIDHDDAALVAAAQYAKKEQMFVGVRKRTAGLRLRSTDLEFSSGEGAAVEGPLLPLLLAMCGREAALDALSGAGVAELRRRL